MSRNPRPRLIGTYASPQVRKGDTVTCLLRDRECVVTGVHGGRIPWPRVQPRGTRGGSGLWVCEELLRAVRTESAEALVYWFGVSPGTVWRWRKAFGVGGTATTPGSEAAHKKACRAGAAGIKAKEWTDAELDRKAAAAKRCGTRLPPRWAETGWTAEQLALLGTADDEAVAARVGRTRSAVRAKRSKRKIPAFGGRRQT